MIFIYPASVSENCDKRIVPAVAKCIERFFLFQLQDAIASGVLPLSRKWDGRNYGPILLECLNNYNKKQMLTESNILMESPRNVNKLVNQISDVMGNLRTGRINAKQAAAELNRLNGYITTQVSHGSIHKGTEEREIKTFLNTCMGQVDEADKSENLNTRADRQDKRAEEELQLKKNDDRRKEDEYERKKKDWEEEKDRNKSMHRTGSYIPMDSKIDIIPTSGTVQTNVLYKGGTLNGKSMEEVDFNISVKVIPTILKNFKVLEKDLLDDYFTKKSENAFTSRGRNIARACHNKLKALPWGMGDVIWKFGMTIAGEDVDKESRKDIIYNTQGFVNASAFHKTSSSPNNYNFTSNIVIFNKDDLTDPEDANIFENRSAMVRLFKMGWSTFCMLDPVEEMMYFISSLDGGFMHYIPYRYMMESYGSRSYYGTESKLKDSAKPFLIKRGNFANFAKQFYKKR